MHFNRKYIGLLAGTGLMMAAGITATAQELQKDTLPYDWYLQDAAVSPYFGISLDKAYDQLKGRKPVRVTVGVIDSGIDTLHEDLQSVLWQVAANKADKHYPGMRNGWSFLGSAKGNVNRENLELTRMIRKYRATGDTLNATYRKVLPEYQKKYKEASQEFNGVNNYVVLLDGLTKSIGKPDPALADLKAYQPKNDTEKGLLAQVIAAVGDKSRYREYYNGAAGYRDYLKSQLDYDLNTAFNARVVVGDKPDDTDERFYGTADISAEDPTHGTHVAGIIAADRRNNKGIMGVADNVSVLAVRAVPSGDERDKDIANAIRFAVDHGAKVINMSFGKAYSPDKKAVDEAVQYALKKDVLLFHAAGNEHADIDVVPNYPNDTYLDGRKAGAWIEVGASGPYRGDKLPAGFSNYGKNTVDLFAPGVEIYSTLPKGTYGRENGTSMACPVVCGIAAMIRSYFPKLSALQVKDILLRSVITDANLLDKCKTGGVVNAAKAVSLALETEKGI